jgi:GntR family transcriptional regulator/MocR family aminotransferase
MTRVRSGPLLTVPLDPGASTPLFRQLYEELRRCILDGTLVPGTRLPATRGLANELGVSRNTVLNSYEQLLAEGYLEGKVGSGTYVPRTLPDQPIQGCSAAPSARLASAPRPALSRRGTGLARAALLMAPTAVSPPFRHGTPALDAFPFETWRRLVARYHRRPPRDLLDYGKPAGYAPLRRAIAAYLGPARAVHCDPEQLLVVTGAQQAFDLIARLLLDPGDRAWVEDPGYPSVRAVLQAAQAEPVAVPVDNEGLVVEVGVARAPQARLVYVTPSHQFPLGITMSLARRLALLDWARRANAWVVEDDYDSEFRYAGGPLAAMQGLDRDGRVIYLGTFSKTLFPSLRLGYLVVPPDCVDAFVAARTVLDRQGATLTQAVVADFLEEGHFVRHIRRMRTLYRERQETLVRAAQRELDGLLEVGPCETGMHLVGWLKEGRDDREACRTAARAGVETEPLSRFCVARRQQSGLLLGYAGTDARQIRDAVRRLGAALRA